LLNRDFPTRRSLGVKSCEIVTLDGMIRRNFPGVTMRTATT